MIKSAKPIGEGIGNRKERKKGKSNITL